ncbi:Utp21 specific WD40 associated putative domain-containing protein, partial [Paraphysoderma sedebokerense]
KHRQLVQPKLFQPFRAIGYVTNDVPFSVQARGQAFFVTTCVGRSFHIYDVQKMGLLFAGPQSDESITALASHGDFTFAASGNVIIVYKRAKEVSRLESGNKRTFLQLDVFGDFLVGLTDDNCMVSFNFKTEELYSEIEFGDQFTATTFVHPSTYLNKILVGSSQGKMQIWNIRTNNLIYEFQAFPSGITALAQSPVVDVIAIGQLDGSITLHNIKLDESIMTLQQEGRATAVSFRTDDHHIMATANCQGDIALWDLDNRRIVHTMKDAHDGSISSIQFLNNQPILLTSGSDNALKQWIFDTLDGLPRLLKMRSGHHAPPSTVRYYDSEGKYLLTSGRDKALRMFSVIRDAQSVELSQGSLNRQSKITGVHVDELKLPPIVSLASCELKQRNWDNIITAHSNDCSVRTWSYQRKAIGDHTLITKDQTPAKSVAITNCGNFALVGAASGRIDMFNIQSGIHRRQFIGHTKGITGIVVDRLNKCVISSSLDKTVKIWDFKTGNDIHTFSFPTAITHLIHHSDNELVAVVGDDLCLRVLDVETRRVVREFWGHRNRITDIAFSPDGRWLVSSSLDSTIKTWDLASGCLVDHFKVDRIATSLAFSPVGDFLASTHVDDLGVMLWSNRAQFSNVSLKAITDDDVVVTVDLPTSAGLDDSEAGDIADPIEIDLGTEYTTPEQLADDIITLSALPKMRWQNLLNLDTIKKRNKPKEPPKAPEKAPFFLPTLPGLTPSFVPVAETIENEASKNNERIINLGDIGSESEFIRFLKLGQAGNDCMYDSFLSHALNLSPSQIDLQIRSLSVSEYSPFLNMTLTVLTSNKYFELLQSWLNVFLKIHGELI